MNVDELVELLEKGNYQQIIPDKTVRNRSTSGGIFVPKKYINKKAIVIICKTEICPKCDGEGVISE